MTSSRVLMLFAMALCLPMVACDSRTSSAGPESSPPLNLVGTVSMEIGQIEGPDEYLFGRISGVTQDDAGRIIVADAQANEIRVFTAEGEFVSRIGGSGQGPGELAMPCCISIDRNGNLWVRDRGNRRYNVYGFTNDGSEFLRQVHMAHTDPNYSAAVTFDQDGSLIDVGHRMASGTGERELVRFHVGEEGRPVREDVIAIPTPEELGTEVVRRASGNTMSMFYVYPPFAPGYFVAHSPDGGWAEALGSQYSVRWFGPDGTLRHLVEVPDAVGAPVSGAEAESEAERVADQLANAGSTADPSRFRVPDHKQPIIGLFFDRLGRLWVQKSVVEGGANQADVYSEEGILVAVIEWPTEVQLNQGLVSEHEALGLTRGEMGEPKVVRVAFLPR